MNSKGEKRGAKHGHAVDLSKCTVDVKKFIKWFEIKDVMPNFRKTDRLNFSSSYPGTPQIWVSAKHHILWVQN